MQTSSEKSAMGASSGDGMRSPGSMERTAQATARAGNGTAVRATHEPPSTPPFAN
jgi:hypothetical protein